LLCVDKKTNFFEVKKIFMVYKLIKLVIIILFDYYVFIYVNICTDMFYEISID